MAIRFVDQSLNLGRINVALADSTSTFTGTFAPAAGRTGTISAQLQPATGSLSGIFTPAPNRTGAINVTLGSATSAFQGTAFVPGTATDVTTFSAGGTGTDFITFGQPFAVGEIPTGQLPIVTTDANGPVSHQADVKALHADGSVRHAIMSALVTGGQSYKIRRQSGSAGSPLTKASLIAALGDTRVVFTGGISATVNIGTLLSSQTNAWLTGPHCIEYRADGAANSFIHVFADCRLYSNGQVRLDVSIENTWAYTSPRQDRSYTYEIILAGVSRIGPSAIPHRAGARVPHTFTLNATSLFPVHNLPYLKRTRAISNFAHPDAASYLAANRNTVFNQLTQTVAVQSNGPFTAQMEGGGSHTDIGPLPHQYAVWCYDNNDVRPWKAVTEGVKGGAAYSIHFRDEATKRVVRIDQHTSAGYERGDFVTGGTNPGNVSSIRADVGHMPSVAYLPYLITGDRWCFEELEFWVGWTWFTNNDTDPMSPSGRGFANGIHVGQQQERGEAWAIRELGRAAYITPDADAHKTYYITRLENNRVAYESYYISGVGNSIFGAIDRGRLGTGSGRQETKTWMDSFVTWAVHELLDFGFSAWTTFAAYKAKTPLGLWGSTPAGYGWIWNSDTAAFAATATGAWFTTWAQAYQNTADATFRSFPNGSQGQADRLNAISPDGNNTFAKDMISGYPHDGGSRYGIAHAPVAKLVERNYAGAITAWQRLRAASRQPEPQRGPPRPYWMQPGGSDANAGAAFSIYPLYSSTGVPTNIGNQALNSVLQLSGTGASLQAAFPSFSGKFGESTAVVYAYSGGCYDPTRRRLMCWGGGHNDYNGNEVQGFSPYDSQAWARITNPSAPVGSSPGAATPSCPDGAPNSTHTYNTVVYDAANDCFVAMGLGSMFSTSGAGDNRIRVLRLATNAWDAYSAHASVATNVQGGAAVYDEYNKVIYRKPGQVTGGLQRYDVATATITTLSDGLPTMNIDYSMAIDPWRQYIIAISGYSNGSPLDNGSARMVLWDLGSISGGTITAYSRTITGWPSALNTAKSGLEFHPPSGSFVAHNGGSTLYRLIPPANPFTGTWTVTQLTPSGSALPSSPDGTYGRFRWCPYPDDPDRGVFCVLQNSSVFPRNPTDVYLFKPNF